MTVEQTMPWQMRMRNYKGWMQEFPKREYQWVATVSFDINITTFESADRILKRCLRTLQTVERIQVGCFYALCRKNANGPIHVHLLMIGEGHSQGKRKTLLDVSTLRWQREWPGIADIQRISSQQATIKYLASQFLRNYTCTMEYYNGNLLRRSWLLQPEPEPDPETVIGSAEWLARYVDIDDED